MDPKDIHQTNFCNQRVDNIISNELKQYVLQDLHTRTGLQFNTRYAKIMNEKYKSNLQNPHIACLKTSGSPYLLFLTKINHINYCLLIDKKVNTGHSLPKMFVVHFNFNEELYNGCLFETELLRDKQNNWSLLLGDVYYYKNSMYSKQKNIIDRVNEMHKMIDNEYTYQEKDICPIYIKKYFEIKDIGDVYQTYTNVPYNIRGFYFIPINVNYSNILYIIQKNDTFLPNKQNKQLFTFKLVKHSKPEIFELYLRNNEGYQKIDRAYIQTIEHSRMIHELFINHEDVFVECEYNSRFQKWKPLRKTTDLVDHIKDFELYQYK